MKRKGAFIKFTIALAIVWGGGGKAFADIASTTYVTGRTGQLSTLTTTEKGTLVGAINELDAAVGAVDSKVGNTTLTTTAQTLTGAIEEVKGGVASAVEAKVDAEIQQGGSIDTAITTAVSTAVGDGLDTAVAAKVDAEIQSGGAIDTAITTAVGANIEGAISDAITETDGAIKTFVEGKGYITTLTGASGTITGAQITDGTITASDISATAGIEKAQLAQGVQDALTAAENLDDVVRTSATAGLLKNDGSVDTNTYLTESEVTGKADKVSGADLDGQVAKLDASGNLVAGGELGALAVKATVGSGEIDASAVTTAKIADNAVTEGKLDNALIAKLLVRPTVCATSHCVLMSDDNGDLAWEVVVDD